MSAEIRNDLLPSFDLSWLSDAANTAGQSIGDAVRSAVDAVQDATIDGSSTSAEAQATELYKQQFGALAHDKDAFHAMMKQVYGDNYDATKAEQYRQMALAGDYSFLPPVQFVSRETLNGANGAYNEAEGVIYLAEDLKGNPSLMQQTFVEEAGHHLDAMLNTGDSLGDEGELFRRLMSGEKLTNQQIADIRAENDHGVIYVDGKKVEVEYWFLEDAVDAVGDVVSDVADAVGDVVSDVGEAIGDAATAVGEAVVDAVTGVAKGVVAVAEGIIDGVVMFGTGLFEGVTGFFGNLVQGNITDAFRSIVRGADKAFLQAPARIVRGYIDGAEEALKGATYLLGPLGKPIREEVIPRVVDVVRQSFNTNFELLRDGFRMIYEVPLGFAQDIEESVKLAFKGEWGEAAKRFGLAFVNVPTRVIGGVVDAGARWLQGTADIVQTGIGLAPPSRALTEDEIAMLREVYGDSIDYDSVRVKFGGPLNADINGRARVVGNYVYFPSSDNGKPLRNADGSLTSYGETLVHEMGHVWQNQNGGGDYIHQALYGQEFGDGYNYNIGIAEGKSFSQLNPEQQADYIAEVLAPILLQPGDAETNIMNDPNLTEEERQYALDALHHIQNGSGTPENLW